MVELEASVERHDLPLSTPFGISRGTTEEATVVAVEVEDLEADDDLVGIGAASPSSYYGEDAGTVEDALPDLVALLETVEAPLRIARGGADPDDDPAPDLARVEDALAEAKPADAAARAALSIALHDLAAKRADLPLYRHWGLAPGGAPPTSYSIGIAEPETMAERARAAVEAGFEHLKVKLGAEDGDAGAASGGAGTAGDDPVADRLGAVREAAPEATLRVDANCAWDRDRALEHLPTLEAHDVALLEQPVPAADVDGLRTVTERASMPVAADEACVDAEEVGFVADACDVVVCKLMKCGGPAAARRQVAAARWHDLDVMLGCMVESAASIAAAWHLAPAAEYADLDGNLLLAEDPYEGHPVEDGRVALAEQERPGTGARRS